MELKDLSISRTAFHWGVPIPPPSSSQQEEENKDRSKHVMYVWFDALANYLTGIDYFNLSTSSSESPPHHFYHWPPSLQIIGQDILWFHAVLFPCILLSASLPLPLSIGVHGFVVGKDGRKLSKSLPEQWTNSCMDPTELIERYSGDALRFYLVERGSFGGGFEVF